MFNKALKYLTNKRADKALALFKRIEKDNSKYKEVYLNMGNCYKLLNNDDKAAECYLLAADPTVPFTDHSFTDIYPEALNNLGMLASKYKNYDVAMELYSRALEKDPNYADVKWNLSNILLLLLCSNRLDDPAMAWDMYDWRYKRSGSPVVLKSDKKVIPWTGEPVESLVVLAEQGFGDQIQFGRYLELLKERVGKFTVQCMPNMNVIFDKYPTCYNPSKTDATHGIGICSLARIFPEKIPPGDWLRDKYIEKTLGETLQIGVTWSGNPDHANDHNRSTTSRVFGCIRDYGDVYTLNPSEAGTPGYRELKSGSWAETISELGKLDLVITVDTSIAHLCGALGKPCWVLMPLYESDWRWGDDSMGSKNVWYKSVRVFRNPGSWDKVMKEVCDELKKLSDGLRSM
jgi:hypothetical protein